MALASFISIRISGRQRKWPGLFVFLTTLVTATATCVRFPNDAPPPSPDGGSDASTDVTVGGNPDNDAPVIPPPVCERFGAAGAALPARIAGDFLSALLSDCRVQRHFTSLPPTRHIRFEECFTAQIGSILGCVQVSGEPFRYPADDSQKQVCRDMKRSHAGMVTSDGDFDAFLDILGSVLTKHEFSGEEVTRVKTMFNPVKGDISKLRDAAAWTQACDAGTADGGTADGGTGDEN